MCHEKKNTQSTDMNGSEPMDTTTEKHASAENTLELELKNCQEMAAEWKNRFVSVTADFQNFKKRIEKEQSQWVRTAQIKVLEPLLNVVDTVERAIEEQKNANLDDAIKKRLHGFTLIQQELEALLNRFHVKRMNNYQLFDPHYHEALMHVDSPDHKSGQIVAVLQQGYIMGDEVVRVAKVSVAR